MSSFLAIWLFYTTRIISIQMAALLLLVVAYVFIIEGSTLKIAIETVISQIILSYAMFYNEFPEIFDNYIDPLFIILTVVFFLTIVFVHFVIPGICMLLEIKNSRVNYLRKVTLYRSIQNKMRICQVQWRYFQEGHVCDGIGIY